MIRILYLGPFRFPDGDAAASRVLNNIRIFKDLGHDVYVLSFGGKYREEDKILNDYSYDNILYKITNDIDTHSWKERFLRYTYPYSNARRIIKETISDYDMLIAYNTTFQMNLFLQRICKQYGKKLVLDLTEWPAANETLGGKWCPIYWMSELNMRFVQKRFKNMIPISQFLNSYYSESNNLLLPPLINIQDSKWNNFSEIDSLKLKGFDGVRILFAGTPAKKDLLGNLIAALLRVLKDTDRIQLVVVGVLLEQAVNYCSQKALDKYKNNLVFLGRIPQVQVPSYYYISDFSAIIREPSRMNTAGFPTKMAESMAAGCPVLMNQTSDLGDYATDGKNALIINDYSVDSIEAGLHRILQMSKDEIVSMKNAARAVGESRFNYRSYLDTAKVFIAKIR